MASNKITKTRGKMVKPILKKLSHSEKNSLDLDRGWDEQSVEQLEIGGGDEGFAPAARDVSFGFAGDASGSSFRAKFQHGRSGSQASATSSGPRGAFVHPFAQTPRTATPPLSYANSLASFDNGRDCSPTITENEDDDEFDTTVFSHSPHNNTHHHHHHLHHPSSAPPPPPAISSQSNLRRPSLNSQRTSSFPEIPSSSKPPSLRINTSRSVSGATSRLAHSVPSPSQSDLHLHRSVDSPTGSSSLGGTSSVSQLQHQLLQQQQQQQQQQHQTTQMSPLRSSLDLSFPRLRSRSELDTAVRAENIRAARRKFEERERVKEEKYDREMIRKRERRDTKEASRIMKGELPSSYSASASTSASTFRPSAPRRRITPTGLDHASGSDGAAEGIGGVAGSVFHRAGTWASGRNSPRAEVSARSSPFLPSSGGGGGTFGSASAPAAGSMGGGGGGHHHHHGLGIGIGKRRHTDSAAASPGGMAAGEKQAGFASRKYESVPPPEAPPAFGLLPGVDDVRFEQTRPRRGSGAKRKTQSYWQGFLLWLRTKLLRLGAH